MFLVKKLVYYTDCRVSCLIRRYSDNTQVLRIWLCFDFPVLRRVVIFGDLFRGKPRFMAREIP
jgi:hypothetical protein